ncbi:hypothetical protein ABIC59_003002 [Priestia aryabhattai]
MIRGHDEDSWGNSGRQRKAKSCTEINSGVTSDSSLH